MSASDRIPTKKGWKILFTLVGGGIIMSIVPLKLHINDLAWIGAGLLVSVVILMIIIQNKSVGWKGLTKEKTN